MSLIASLRKDNPALQDYTDAEVLEGLAKINQYKPGSSQYKVLESNLLGYDRTAIGIAADTGVGLTQAVMGLGKTAGTVGGALLPGVKAFDNPVTNKFGEWARDLDQYKTQGLRNQEAGARINVDVAERTAEANGSGAGGQLMAGIGAQAQNYWNNPSLAFQDFAANAPQMLAGGLIGRGVQGLATMAGVGTAAALRAGVAGGISASGAMQGSEVGVETYQRARALGVSHEQANELATAAAVKSGAASMALSRVSGAATIERSMLRGAVTPRSFGLGRAGTVARVTGTEMVTEGLDEGYGQYAGNQGVQEVDPNTNLMSGVGSAAVQGMAASGPIAAYAGLRTTKPRTATGEIDLTGAPPPAAPAPLDEPAYQRRGLDPLNERSSPYPMVPDRTMADIAGPVLTATEPATYTDLVAPSVPAEVDPYTAASTEGTAKARAIAQQERRAAIEAGTSAQGPGVMMATPDGTVLPAQSPAQMQETERARKVMESQPPAPPAPDQAVAPNRGQLLTALQAANNELGKNTVKKDGELSNTRGTAPLRAVLEAPEPLAAMRELYQDGTAPRDELIDVWHKNLTGQTVFEWKAAQQAAAPAAVTMEAPQDGRLDAVGDGRSDGDGAGAQAVAPIGQDQQAGDAPPQVTGVLTPAVPGAPAPSAGLAVPDASSPVDAQPALKPKKAKAPKLGDRTSAELIEIAENTKDDGEYSAARYELYRKWAKGDPSQDEDAKVGPAEAYLTDKKNKSALTDAETAEFKQRYADEQEAAVTKKGQALGKKFDATKYRAADGSPSGIPVQQAQSVADAVSKGWKNAPAIEVVAGMADLPAELREQAEQDGVQVLKAAYLDGTVWVVADNHGSLGDVVTSVLHEVAGHHGLRGLLGDSFAATMRQIHAGNPAVRKAADALVASEGLPLETAVEEVLADMAEQGRVQMSIVERIGNAMRQLMRKVGLGKFVAEFSDADVKELLAAARQFVESGTAGDRRGSDKAVYRSALLAPFSDAAKEAHARTMTLAKGEDISTNLLNVMATWQIEEQFGRRLPALKAWTAAIDQRAAAASKLASAADRVALQWERALKKPGEREAMADVLLRASVVELELDNVKPDYLASLSPADRAEHTALRQKLATLSPETQQVRKEALAILKQQWEYTRKALETFIKHTIQDPDLRSQRLTDLNHEMGRNRGDYFPLSRFGDKVVIGHGAAPDGRDVVSFHETDLKMNEEVDRLKQAGFRTSVNKQTDRDSRERASTGFMGDLHAAIDKSEADSSVKDSIHEALQQLYLKSLPELSGAKHMIRRANVAGFSVDALRVFADSVTRGARYAAQLEFAPAVQAAREAAEAQSRSSDKRTAAIVIGRKDGAVPVVRIETVGTARFDAVNEMNKAGYTVEFFNAAPETVREKLAGSLKGATPVELDTHVAAVEKAIGRTETGVEDMRAAKTLYNHMIALQKSEAGQESSPLVQSAGRVGYTWFLGLSPAFWAMNLLQNPMIGVPQLGSKYGIGKSSAALLSSASWFAKVRMGKLWSTSTTPFSIGWLRGEVKANNITGISEAELKMLQHLEDNQALDFTQAMDLTRIGQATGQLSHKFMRIAAAGAHHTEVFNRVTFALAAYRLALQSGSDVTHEKAIDMAHRDLRAAHFDYTADNKPMLMRGRYSRLLFMFQQYRQHMLYWWAKNFKQAVKNEAPGDRVRALKAGLYMGVTNLVFAGATGLPFIGAVALLANLMGSDDEDGVPFDFNKWMTDAAVDAASEQWGEETGRKVGEVAAKGIFSILGMEIGQRIGQANLLPFANEGSAKFERNTDDRWRAYFWDLAGPLGSIALGGARALDAFERGDTAGGIAHVTPKFASDVLKAYKLETEGMMDKDRVNFIATAEAFDGWDIFKQAVGVSPTKVANIKADGAAVRNMDMAIKDRTRQLTGQFVEAWMRSDREGVAEVVEDVKAFNQKLASRGLAGKQFLIDGRQLETAIKDRQQRAMRLALTGGTAETRRQLLIATRMSTLFNPVTIESMHENARGGLPGMPGMPGMGGN